MPSDMPGIKAKMPLSTLSNREPQHPRQSRVRPQQQIKSGVDSGQDGGLGAWEVRAGTRHGPCGGQGRGLDVEVVDGRGGVLGVGV